MLLFQTLDKLAKELPKIWFVRWVLFIIFLPICAVGDEQFFNTRDFCGSIFRENFRELRDVFGTTGLIQSGEELMHWGQNYFPKVFVLDQTAEVDNLIGERVNLSESTNTVIKCFCISFNFVPQEFDGATPMTGVEILEAQNAVEMASLTLLFQAVKTCDLLSMLGVATRETNGTVHHIYN